MTKIKNETYSHVRGFNYQPGYARNGLDAWLDRFDSNWIEREISLGKKYFPNINTLRIWLSFDAFLDNADTMAANFDTVIDIGGDKGLRFIPVLFNAWHSIPDFGGISVEQIGFANKLKLFPQYFDSIVGRHSTDERILIWDLCNEPFNNAYGETMQQVMMEWLNECYRSCKERDVVAPVAVGACPSIEQMSLLEPISDVITFHPYFAWNEWTPEKFMFSDFVDQCAEFANKHNKSAIATETCWGSLDDAQRTETLSFELEELSKRGIGFTAHLMCHSGVADAHRRWTGDYKGAGYMGFINADGTLRPGHEAFNNF